MKKINNYEKFKLIRPLDDSFKKTNLGIPILKSNLKIEDFESVKFSTFSNLKQTRDRGNKGLLFFQHDKTINCVWNDPLKYISKFSGFKFITTPDYSCYYNMDPALIIYNTYRSNWLGCFYQSKGFNVIKTVSWAKEDTFDICFDCIEKESIVCISTIGCQKNKTEFLRGFNVLKEKVKPSLIIVKGDLIKGMTGKFIFVSFEDTFNLKTEQLKFDFISNIINIEEVK